MAGPEPLLTISSFARLVGLSPSALRFYDDCGLLRPTDVDPRSGYRYYTAEQERRAVLIRRLRRIDLPLQEIRAVLDGPRDEGVRVLRAHVESSAHRADQAREVADDVIAALPDANGGSTEPTTLVIGGPELASAVRQVSPAVARDESIAALTGVLLDITPDELVVVATDRYWMAMRTLPATEQGGPACRLLVPADELVGLASWASRHHRVRLRATSGAAELEADGDVRVIAVVNDEFPSYQAILAGLPEPTSRAIVDRQRLLDEVLAAEPDEPLVLTSGPDHLDLRVDGDRHGVRLTATCSGAPMAVAFQPALLAGALATSVGPDVLLEASATDRPVVVRSADQGSFTTLVMPTRRADEAQEQ
ncbi:MerR family transcriptional regulator [Luteipulveratus mongoliensis]|uniref:HTH merR-type domain-containing protein n=1 Tax=Luteipulveratus mongoliensis TaxID=571913 RepID=A0A0K1JPK5_9MICO|nr:MerR family transcriptional regulator [Luteipulveratus mongoliensis]AKU18652.1 hypothetical protein VV02_05165 [Luteipulveratus mongoliensis]